MNQKDRDEREDLRRRQAIEREELRAMQAKRRKRSATTKSGGARKGAGRPPKDGRKRQTYTFYGTAHEREQVRRFLRTLRTIEQDHELAYKLFYRLNGMAVYDLLASGDVCNPDQRRLIESIMPSLLED